MRIEINAGGLNSFFNGATNFAGDAANSAQLIRDMQRVILRTNNLPLGNGTLGQALRFLDLRIQAEERRVASVIRVAQKTAQFRETTIATDNRVATMVNNEWEKFYRANEWLRPTPPPGVLERIRERVQRLFNNYVDSHITLWSGVVNWYIRFLSSGSIWESGPTAGRTDNNVYAYVWGMGMAHQYGAVSSNSSIYALYTEAKGDFRVALWDDKYGFRPGLQIKGGTSASAIRAETNGMLGSEDFGLSANSQGDILTARLHGGVSLGFDNYGRFQTYAEAGAKASVASGQVSNALYISGLRIEFGVRGHAVAAGVEARVGYFEHDGRRGFHAQAGAAKLVGGGFFLNVSW